MPPKKNASEPALVAILNEAGVKNSQEISDSLLRKLYKLEDDVPSSRTQQSQAGPSNGINGYLTRAPIHTFKACDNAWNTADKRREALAREAARTSKAAAKRHLRPAGGQNADGEPVLDPSCTYAHCRDNPRCLNWLGQTMWEDNKAFDKFAKQWGLSDNPEEEARDPDIPVGLKNLGSTCYVNSYLQVWFQDEPFRRGVYACAPDPDKELASQPLYNLQVTFAALQEAQVKAFSPVDLVKSLGIDTTDQQDAQEFAKLLMTLLENQFAKQPDPELKTLIARQFEGKMKYGTRCKWCKRESENTSSFKELEIPLKNNRTLSEQLHLALQDETLSGDNQYKCEGCNKLRDAVRYTNIVQLPPVLHFSLMRFQYDYRANERKRSNATIKFPKSIDMAEFIPGAKKAEWYDLRGILSHKGTSAHHGHYIAEILDARRDLWFRFDDETVTQLEIDPPQKQPSKKARVNSPSPVKRVYQSSRSNKVREKSGSPIDIDSSSDSDVPVVTSTRSTSTYSRSTGPYAASKLAAPQASSSSSTAGTSKRRVIDDDSDVETNRVATNDTVIDSKDAYMLVYVRRGRDSDMQEDEPVVPQLAQQRLQEKDSEITAQVKKYQEEEIDCRRDFEEIRTAKRSVYRVWHASTDDEPSVLVDRDALQSWLTAEISPAKKSENASSKEVASKTSVQNSSDSGSDCVLVASKRSPAKTPQQTSNSKGVNGSATRESELNDRTLVGTSSSRQKGKEKLVEAAMNLDELSPEVMRKPTTPSFTIKPKSEQLMSSDHKTQTAVDTRSHSLPPSGHRMPGRGCVDISENGRVNGQDKGHGENKGHANGHIVNDGMVKAEAIEPEDKSGSTSRPDHNGSRRATLRHVSVLDSNNLVCPHGGIQPVSIPHMKRVSTVGIAALVGSGVEILPELLVPDSLCRQCVFEPLQSRSYLKEHKVMVMRFETYRCGHSNPVHISKMWLDDWLRDNPAMHKTGDGTDPSPDDPQYQDDVICEHGALAPDEMRRVIITGRQADLLQTIFPDWSPTPRETELCSICKESYDQKLHQQSSLKQLAMKEKNNRDFARLVKNYDFKPIELVPTRQDEEMRAVPTAWLREWRDWLKKATVQDRPRAIDLRPYLCHHARLILNFNFPDERREFEIVSQNEWLALMGCYRSKGALEVAVTQFPGGRYATRPSVCETCRDERRRDFDEISINLHFLIQEDMDPDTGLPKTAITIDDIDDSEGTPTPVATRGERRSTRARRPPGSSLNNTKRAIRRKPESISVKKLDKLKDIRVLIQQITNVPTIYQRVFFKGREIDDSSETVESIGITQSEALQVLLLDVPDEDDVDIDSFDHVVPVTRSRSTNQKKPKSNGRAEGFAGTVLSGLDVPPSESEEAKAAREAKAAMEAQEREEAEIRAALPGVCRHCTFENDPSVKQCEVCENDL